MDIDAKIAASNAKLSVLKNFEQGADSIVTDGMESYVNEQSKSTTVSLHPDVKKQPRTALESRKGVTSQPRASHHSQRNVSSRSRIPGSSDGGFDSTQNVLQKQREITELLIQHQKSHHLPPREIPVFEGILCSSVCSQKLLNIVWRKKQITRETVYIFLKDTQEGAQEKLSEVV